MALPAFHPKPGTTIVPFGQIMERGLPSDLDGTDMLRWKAIPQGGNFENLPSHLRTKAKFSNMFRKLAVNKPSYTLLKTFSSSRFFHPLEPRLISQRERARIGSFPDAFVWLGSRDDIVMRIGNAVPPLFMQAIAEHVYITFLQPVKRRDGQ